MVKTELILINELQTSPTTDDIVLVNCPIIDDIAIPVTLQISDVRKPGEGSGSFTKSTSIPGTPEVDKFFENVYDVNVSLQYFNPNLKIKAHYLVDGIPNFEGYLQILKIKVDEVTKTHTYEVNILGQEVTFFTKIKNLLVENLNFSSYSHALSYANISASWATPLFSSGIGSGVVYGLVDWGTNNSNLYNVRPQDFKPALFYREILQKIFLAQGYTWTSTFLDSVGFKRKVMPACNFLTVSDTIANNNKFLATAGGAQVITESSTVFLVGNKVGWGILTVGNVTEFPTETYDTGNIYNNATYQFTVPNTAKYNLNANVNLGFVVKKNGVDVNANITVQTASGVHIKIYNSTTATVEAIGDLNIQGNQGDLGTNTYNGGVALNNVTLTAGHIYYILINIANVSCTYTADPTPDTWTLETTVNSTSNFSAQLASSDPFENQTVTINDMLPLNYKQSDFVRDVFATFHIQCKVDPTNPTNLILEPEPQFRSTTSVSWENKHAKDSEVEVIPLGELDFNVLKCRYSEDGDYYNKIYQDEYKEPYGSYQKIIQNDFIKNERVIQTNIAPTPYAVNYPSNVVLPQILKKDNSSIGTIKPKIRMLHWSGTITLPAGASWVFKYNNGANQVVYNTQPHIGHADTPYTGITEDLSWGVPKRVYFNYANAVWTTNNLYNKYYSQYFNQITDKNSKLIRTRFYLTANDIHIFDFQKPIFTVINGQQGYYIVNKIEDYNPLVNETTMVELLKLTAYDAFTPEEVVIEDPGDGGDNNSGFKVMGGNYTQGQDNTNVGQNSMVSGGSGNYIANSSDSVSLFSSTNAIVVEDNFFGVNLDSSSEIDSNMINLQDKVKIYSDGHGALAPRVLRVTADFVVDGTYSIYEIDLDTTGIAITATWDAVAYPITVTFKIVANASLVDFIIDDMTSPPSSPAQTLDGNSLPFTTGLVTYESLTIYSNGANLFII